MGRVELKVLLALLVLVALLPAQVAYSQTAPASGRFSLFAHWSEREPVQGEQYDFSEIIATLSLFSDPKPETRFEFGLDARVATYPDTDDRDERISIYEAWIGARGPEGRWRLRLGQMWLRELGGLGSLGGFFGEFRTRRVTSFGQWRLGLFAGLEPQIRDTGYVDDVEKGGAYVAVDGAHGRRHVLGWVMVRNRDLTERSVVVFSNFIPSGRKLFFYQALEYDLEGPAGLGEDELTYFFSNLRYAPARVVQFQATYHRGRSIDARSITEDVLDGRPVNPERLAGLLFESGRFRITVNPWRRLRIWAGYGRDKNNRLDEWTDRVNYGFSFNNVGGVGLDFTASNSEIDRLDRSYDTTYVSLGKTLGRRVYLSLDYTSSLSVFHFRDGNGGTIETRPESDRYSLSLNANISRLFSLLLVGEWMDHDDYEEIRVLTGVTFRF
jgi:hypothetical protein